MHIEIYIYIYMYICIYIYMYIYICICIYTDRYIDIFMFTRALWTAAPLRSSGPRRGTGRCDTLYIQCMCICEIVTQI